jgi:hypothetical protein
VIQLLKKYFNNIPMQEINSTSDLADAIARLESKQAEELEIMQEQSRLTFESLKPINIIKNTIHDATSSGALKNNLLNTTAGLTTGFLLKKLLVGSSKNPITKMIGSVVMFGVTNLIGKHPGFMIALKDKFFDTITLKRNQGENTSQKKENGQAHPASSFNAAE